MKAITNVPLYCSLYPRICEVGRSMGYAICIHGSLEKDLDLLAVPWIELPATPETLAEAVAKAVEGTMPIAGKPNASGGFDEIDMRIPVAKPHGRFVWTIVLKGGMYLDLGVIAPFGWEPKPASAVPRHVTTQTP